MSNKDKNKDKDSQNGTDRSPPVGALLRASRLRVGEDLRAVADVLCIRYPYLEAIENCRYELLPGNTYAVGFIRTYAEHLGLDGDEVVRRYRAEQVGKKNATDLAFPTPVQDSGVPKGAIVFIGVMLALFVYGGWYVTTTDESILSDLISPVPDHLKEMASPDATTGTATMSEQAAAGTASQPQPSQTTGSGGEADAEKVSGEAADAAQQMAKTASEAAASVAEAVAPAAETVTSTPASEGVPAKPVEAAAEIAKPAAEAVSAGTTPKTVDPAVKAVNPIATAAESQATKPVASVPAKEPAKPAMTAQPTQTVQNPEAPVVSTPSTAAVTKPVTEQVVPVEKPSAETTSAAAVAAANEQPKPAANEVTAEDLNKLVLRQATGTPAQSAAQKPASTKTLSDPTVKASGIVINATASSWVEIRNPQTGAIVFTGLMKDGSNYSVPDIKGLTLDTGNAGALKITVDGSVVPEIGGVGAVRKNVALDAARLKAGTAVPR